MQHKQSQGFHSHGVRIAAALAILALLPLNQVLAQDGTLDRIRQAGTLRLGYRADAGPFAYQDASGKAAGYAVALCQRLAEDLKAEPGLADLTVEWVPVTLENRFSALQQGSIDVLCGTDGVTIERRKDVGFSIPIYPGGIGAMLRDDAPFGLRNVLEGRKRFQVLWRATPAEVLQKQTFSVLAGSTAENWLAGRLEKFQIDAKVVPVDSYDAGVARVADGSADVFFAERAVLLDAARRSPAAGDLQVLDRRFTHGTIALALQRGDEDFRMIVDRTLSRLFASDGFASVYAKWFGEPDDATLTFFRTIALPD